MGCDIHLYREKLIAGKWVTADQWSAYQYGDEEGMEIKYNNRAYSDRNYDFFGALAKGVRREFDFSFEPRGMPLTASPEVASDYEGYGCDAHGASYLYLHELRELAEFAKSHTMPVSGLMAADQYAKLSASIASGTPDWSLLYPYCQGTTDRSYVQFTVDVPCGFKFGECLDQVIRSFKGVDGENHRIVFWFDN